MSDSVREAFQALDKIANTAIVPLGSEIDFADAMDAVKAGLDDALRDYVGANQATSPQPASDWPEVNDAATAYVHDKAKAAGFLPHELTPNLSFFAGLILADAVPPTPFQERVSGWMQECFGPEISADKVERNHRFLEEALELVQSLGCTQTEAHKLVDYVYGRAVGEPPQEVGGVMVTLAALCLASGMDMDAAAETELARILRPEVITKIREKQKRKPAFSPLPGSYPERQPAQEKWLLRLRGGYRATRGLYSRPGHKGYTNNLSEAGRFTEQEAKESEAARPDKYRAIPDTAPDHIPAAGKVDDVGGWPGSITRSQAIKILNRATDKDDPHWEFVVQDFYDEASDTMPSIFHVFAAIGVTENEYRKTTGAQNIDWPAPTPSVPENEMAMDAERYRWLRQKDNFPGDEGDGPSLWDQLCEVECDEFDEFIDRLRTAGDEGEEA